ncbi:MAG: hypothetical protein ACPL2N_05955, partial [Candidatus Cryosericum sp.]
FSSTGASFERGESVVLVFPYWGGDMVPAVSGLVRSIDLTGVTVFLVMTRSLNGGDELLSQLEDDITRQGGITGGVFSVRTLWRGPQRLSSLGKRIGHAIEKNSPQGIPQSLAERLEDVIDDMVDLRDRYLQLVEITPDTRLKRTFRLLAADEVAHMQQIQQLYRTYTGVVHEPHRPRIAPLTADQMHNFIALVQELGVNVDAEKKAAAMYQAIGRQYASQTDVVREMSMLLESSSRRSRRIGRLYRKLSRQCA